MATLTTGILADPLARPGLIVLGSQSVAAPVSSAGESTRIASLLIVGGILSRRGYRRPSDRL